MATAAVNHPNLSARNLVDDLDLLPRTSGHRSTRITVMAWLVLASSNHRKRRRDRRLLLVRTFCYRWRRKRTLALLHKLGS
jgi:hypothetical protein